MRNKQLELYKCDKCGEEYFRYPDKNIKNLCDKCVLNDALIELAKAFKIDKIADWMNEHLTATKIILYGLVSVFWILIILKFMGFNV